MGCTGLRINGKMCVTVIFCDFVFEKVEIVDHRMVTPLH
jgi:hypothetical protein